MYGTYYKRAATRTEISMMLIFLIFCNYYKLSSTSLRAGGDVGVELSHISLFRDYAPNYFPGNISHTEKAESKVWYARGKAIKPK